MKIPTLKNACKSGIMLACAGLFLSFAQQSNAAATSAIISLGSAGAFGELSTTTSYTWNFHWNGDSSYSFDSAEFQLAAESGIDPTATISFSLYDSYGGVAGGGTNLIPGTFLTVSQVTGSVNAFTYGPINPLPAGDYSIVLSSDATGSKTFKVKPGSFKINVDPSLYTTDGNTTGTSTIPETSSSIMAAVGVLGMLSFRRRNTAA